MQTGIAPDGGLGAQLGGTARGSVNELDDQAGPGETGEGWHRVSPTSIAANSIAGIGSAVLPMVAIFLGSGADEGSGLLALIVGCLAVSLSVLFAALTWWRTRYRLGDTDVAAVKGLISRQARSIPFERIQDVSLEQKLVPRLFGLVAVRFETGAGAGDELALAYVTRSEGETLREAVRARLDSAPDAMTGGIVAGEEADADRQVAAGDAPPQAAGPTTALFAMGPARLLMFGLFEFSLVVFAVLGGAAQQFDFLLPFDLWDMENWEARLAGSDALIAGWLAQWGWAARLVGVVLGVLGLALIGLATGIVRTFAREWGFTLERTARGFRRRRGLFTRTDVVMPVHRVQALRLTTGMVRRLWGWHALSFITLAQDAGSANHAVAPFARLDELARVAHEAGFALPGDATRWHRPAHSYGRDRAMIPAIPGLLVALVLLALGQPLPALVVALVALLIGCWQILIARAHRHALEPEQIVTRVGLLAPRITIATRAKLHSAELAQGPLGRRSGYASLRMGLAGGRLRIDGLPLDRARQMRDEVLTSIVAVDYSALPR